ERSELDRVGALVASEPLAAERDDLVGGRGGPAAERDESFGSLAPVLVRNPDHRALENRRMSDDRLLYLDARDVLAAGDDDVLAAVTQLDVAVRVPHGEIPRVEPAAVECFCG